MTGFSEKDCVACERCGAFIPKVLVSFHKCLGTDLSKRPANIPLETWLETRSSQDRDFAQMLSFIREFSSTDVDDDLTTIYESKVRKKRSAGFPKPPAPPPPPPPKVRERDANLHPLVIGAVIIATIAFVAAIAAFYGR